MTEKAEEFHALRMCNVQTVVRAACATMAVHEIDEMVNAWLG